MSVAVSRERRAISRGQSTMLTACLDLEGRTTVAIMRDFSDHGAGFECDKDVAVGQTIRYRWGDQKARTGEVIWQRDGRFGVVNTHAIDSTDYRNRIPRSVRVPLTAPADIYTAYGRIEAEVLNIAHRGLCFLASKPISKGTLATIKLGRRRLEFVTAKWSEGERFGVSFPKPITVYEMAAMLEGA